MNIESGPDDPIDPVSIITWKGEFSPEETAERNIVAVQNELRSKRIAEVEQKHDIERVLGNSLDSRQMKLAHTLATATLGATELANKEETIEIRKVIAYDKEGLANILLAVGGKERSEALEFYRAVAENFLESN